MNNNTLNDLIDTLAKLHAITVELAQNRLPIIISCTKEGMCGAEAVKDFEATLKRFSEQI
jgi:hypothetical protein